MLNHTGITRTFSALLLASLLIIGAASPGYGADDQGYTLRILHTNDHHAHIEPVKTGDKELGGVARRKTAIDEIRAAGGNLLLLDAGDVFQGTLYFNLFSGQADLYFYNKLGYDAMALGNHEFDKGQTILAEFVDGADFPILGANVVPDPTSPLAGKIEPWIIKELGGQKIGIFGLTTEDVPVSSSPGPGIAFTPHVEAAGRAVAELSARGANKIIALTHLGFDLDQRLAGQVAGIDVIVGGHSHTVMGDEEGAASPYPLQVTAPDGGRVLIVQNGEWGKTLGDLSVEFDSEGRVVGWRGSPIPIDESLKPDPSFQAKIAEYGAPLDALLSSQIGRSTVELVGDRSKIRSEETNLGNLVADAMLEKTRAEKAQIAIINGGGIRTSIATGDVSMGQVLEVLPFGNTLVRLDLSGTQLKEALENGVSEAELLGGRFPQVAGMRFMWDPDAPAGSRVIAIEVAEGDGYRPIDPNAVYRVATNDYLAGGGDGYTVFESGANWYATGFVLADVVADYIREHSPVAPQVEGRIMRASSRAEKAVASPAGQGAGERMIVPAALPNTGEAGTDPAESAILMMLVTLGTIAVSGGIYIRKR